MKKLYVRVAFLILVLSLSVSLNANTSMMGQPPLPQLAANKTPAIKIDPRTGRHKVTFSVLIYNIAGLPWPIKSGRGERLDLIAEEFARMREKGTAPDLVLLQEAFMDQSRDIIFAGGYENYITGPATEDIVEGASAAAPQEFIAARNPWRGETWGKVINSGLYIMSKFPIVEEYETAFPRQDCAGWDCLANKGVMMAGIRIPGVPFLIDVANTHMNSKGPSSGVDLHRTTAAQRLQVDTIHTLLNRTDHTGRPLIMAGDFNLKGLPEMVDYFRRGRDSRRVGLLARQYCLDPGNGCDVRMPLESNTPWLDTNDLQAFHGGDRVRLRPLRVEVLFDEKVGDEPLSDHDGYLVHYELSWHPDDFPTQIAGL
ncbi:endonuclease/exonuclease/phosphatase family protein [Emcibacter sp.]|uniref:endonuclease/exonuclease/phosphatase family protein n=1 Tax=Emcibacter sp. TaxID=1979954 RepID=UPI002AA73292|nr:endonuclease/exonuclease/phosphatase family protein [Emcibacter sp.]